MGCCTSTPATHGADSQPTPSHNRNTNVAPTTAVANTPPQLPLVSQHSSGAASTGNAQPNSRPTGRHRLSLGVPFGRAVQQEQHNLEHRSGSGVDGSDDEDHDAVVQRLGEHPNRPLRQPLASELRLPSSPITRGPPTTSTAPLSPQTSSHHHQNTQTSNNSTLVPSISPASSPPPRQSQQWTRSRLQSERTAFFDTRVTGQAEVWASLRLVAELLDTGAVEDAQGVFDATGCTCPTGQLWRGVFDERGALYRVPTWCLGVPREVTEEGAALDGSGKEAAGEARSGIEELGDLKGEKLSGSASISEVPAVALGASKAEAKEAPQKLVKVRARLSDRATDVVVKTSSAESVGEVISKVVESAGLPSTARIRIAYMGKILDESAALADQGWHTGHVVNALVFAQS